MKVFYLLFLVPLSLLADEQIAIDWTSKRIKVEETDSHFIIEWATQAQAGQKLILTGRHAHSNKDNVVLWFQIVQNSLHSYRHLESVTVRWEIDRNDFLKWKNDEQRYFFIQQKDNARLSAEHVKEIKKSWK